MSKFTDEQVKALERQVKVLEQIIDSANLDWKPIATAPDNAAVIDVWHKDGYRICDHLWGSKYIGGCNFDEETYTHWKPVTKPENVT